MARCKALVEQTSIPSNDERLISLSISVGAALVHPGETAEQLIQRADERMYQIRVGRRGGVTD